MTSSAALKAAILVMPTVLRGIGMLPCLSCRYFPEADSKLHK